MFGCVSSRPIELAPFAGGAEWSCSPERDRRTAGERVDVGVYASVGWVSSRELSSQPSCVDGSGGAGLAAGYYSASLGEQSSTRLVTRTKEVHGCASVRSRENRARNESEFFVRGPCARRTSPREPRARVGVERSRGDPKDGELYLVRTKPEETLVEVLTCPDVQIGKKN